MAYRAGAKGTSRDFGLNHGTAGKGSAPRNNFSQNFRENFDAIQWPTEAPTNMTRKGNRLVKKYS